MKSLHVYVAKGIDGTLDYISSCLKLASWRKLRRKSLLLEVCIVLLIVATEDLLQLVLREVALVYVMQHAWDRIQLLDWLVIRWV